jgi:hypothetical protein
MIQYPEFSLKPPAEHGIINPLGTIVALEHHHARQVGISLVGMQIASWMKTPDLHGVDESDIFEIDHIDVAIDEEEQVDQLIGDEEMA